MKQKVKSVLLFIGLAIVAVFCWVAGVELGVESKNFAKNSIATDVHIVGYEETRKWEKEFLAEKKRNVTYYYPYFSGTTENGVLLTGEGKSRKFKMYIRGQIVDGRYDPETNIIKTNLMIREDKYYSWAFKLASPLIILGLIAWIWILILNRRTRKRTLE